MAVCYYCGQDVSPAQVTEFRILGKDGDVGGGNFVLFWDETAVPIGEGLSEGFLGTRPFCPECSRKLEEICKQHKKTAQQSAFQQSPLMKSLSAMSPGMRTLSIIGLIVFAICVLAIFGMAFMMMLKK